MPSYKANEVLNPVTPGLGKALVDGIKAGQLHLQLASVTEANSELLKKLLGVQDLKPFLSDGRKRSESGENARAVGCDKIYSQLEELAKAYKLQAKKSEHFKSGGTGDLVLYVRS